MRHIADRFKLLMMDDAAVTGAQLVVQGAPYWRTRDGGMGTASDARVVNLGKRQAGQVRSLLGIAPTHTPQRIEPGRLPAHLRRLLEVNHPEPVHEREHHMPERHYRHEHPHG